MRSFKIIGLGIAWVSMSACSTEAKPPASSAVATKAKAKAEPESEAKPEPNPKASELLVGARGQSGARKRLEDAAATVRKGPSPVAPPVPTPPDVAQAPSDATKTPSGLAYKILAPGTGDAPPKGDQLVKVHYSGWTPQGRLFDSSVSRNSPITFALDEASAGWREALSAMKVGERRRLWMSQELARQDGLTLPPGPLVYELELIAISDG